MTYGERKAITIGFQANSICGDLRDSNGRDAIVDPTDEAKIALAEYADANDIPYHVACEMRDEKHVVNKMWETVSDSLLR